MGKFARSWEITKLSFGVIKQDKELLWFPILGFLISILFIMILTLPILISFFIEGVLPKNLLMTYLPFQIVFLYFVYLGLAMIFTFFNFCIVYTTKIRFDGGNASFGQSIKFTLSKIHLVFLWSLLAATVGLIFKLIEGFAKRIKGVGEILIKILLAFLKLGWNIITLFVVPAMVYKELGPIDAIKKSTETLKKTWGESLIRYFGLGLVQFVVIVLGVIILGIPLALWALVIGLWGWIITGMVIFLYVIFVSLIFSLANSIFNTALFVYADTGKVPATYSKEVLENAFKSKEKNSIFSNLQS